MVKENVENHLKSKWLPEVILSLFWIRIWIRSDPYHLAGSGSTSGNVDPDPGSN